MNTKTVARSFDHKTDILSRLQNVVIQLKRSDIRTTNALISKMLGDRNAAQMCMRLLHWFPRSRNPAGWVYKSWRNWDAECDLSLAQVKRVHEKRFLEKIGIERKNMKANGCATMHYRLHESQFVSCLAVFLNIPLEQMEQWMDGKTVNADGDFGQTNKAETAQVIQSNSPNQVSSVNPSGSAQIAKPITDLDLQVTQHNDNHNQQHNTISVVAADSDSRAKEMLIQSLMSFGISKVNSANLVQKHGYMRVDEVVKHMLKQNPKSPAGYILKALEHEWILYSPPEKEEAIWDEGKKYITGKYASFIEH